jgi:hypothetical protein
LYFIQNNKLTNLTFFTKEISKALENLKRNYSFNTAEENEIIDKICYNLASRDKEEQGFKEHLLDLIKANINDNTIYKEILNSDSIKQDKLLESIDSVIEMKYSNINTLKQIRNKLTLNTLYEDHQDKHKTTSNEESKDIDKYDKCVHLYELEQIDVNRNNPTDGLETKINSVNINYKELREREKETQDLKDNLICELEEFQREFNNKPTLEDLLSNDEIN